MSSQEHEIIYYMIVITFYKTREAFCSFDNKDYIAFIYRLNPIYKHSRTQLLIRWLIDKVYNNIQGQL